MSRPRRRGRDINGVLLLDKPQGMSSNDALQKVKRIYNANRAGHTGALDPLATGMLPICLGEATKFSQYLLDSDKRYRVIARLAHRVRRHSINLHSVFVDIKTIHISWSGKASNIYIITYGTTGISHCIYRKLR